MPPLNVIKFIVIILSKIWCAAGVNLAGGRTKDGGEIVGASVFYSKPPSNCEASHDGEANNPVEQLEKDIEVN